MERKFPWIPFIGFHTYNQFDARHILSEIYPDVDPREVAGLKTFLFSWFDFEFIIMGKVVYAS